jgi:quinolinate synthase
MAHFVASTSGLLRHVSASPKRSFIVATEEGILHQMHRAAPDKELIPAPPEENCACNTCPHMKRNTLEKLYLCLRDLEPQIHVGERVRLAAKRSIDRMLEMTAGMSLQPAGNRS